MNKTKLRDKADKLERRGKHKKLIPVLQQLAESDPYNGRWTKKLGQVHQKLGQDRDAVKAYSRAVEAFARTGFMLKAIAVCKLILQLDPEHVEAQSLVAQLYTRQKDQETGVQEAVSQSKVPQPRERPAEPAARPRAPVARRPEAQVEPNAPLNEVNLREAFPAEPASELNTAEVYEIPLPEEDAHSFPVEENTAMLRARLPRTPLFSSLNRYALRMLIEGLEVEQYGPGETVIRQGERGDSLYVVAEGELAAVMEGQERRVVSQMGEGSFFGEIGLLSDTPCSLTVETLGSVTVLRISRLLLHKLITAEAEVLRTLLTFFRGRLVNSLAEASPLFEPFQGERRDILASKFRFIQVEAATVLQEINTPPVGVFAVLIGELQVATETEARSIGQRGLCGADTIARGGPAPARITTTTRSWLLSMDADTFRQLLEDHPSLKEAALLQ